jgi:hypothetical protein
LARVAHFSVSTVAEATAGRRLPSDQVVRAFATACNDDPDVWSELLAAAVAGRARESDSADGSVAGSDEDGPARRHGRFIRSMWTITAVTALCGGYAAGTLNASSSAHRTPAAPTAPSYTYPASDGTDPIVAGCTGDAQLIDKTPFVHNGLQVGALELKYSARCHAGWARAYLYPGGVKTYATILASVEVTSEDGTAAMFAAPLLADVPNYTDVIQPHGGCLSAVATIGAGTPESIRVTLPCGAPPAHAVQTALLH